MTNQETSAVTLLTQATMKAAVHIAIKEGINKQKDFADRLTEALKITLKDNISRVMKEWEEALSAKLGNAWLQKMMTVQSIELANLAVKSLKF